MALRFVLGRAGSGKTRHCLAAVAGALRAEEGLGGEPCAVGEADGARVRSLAIPGAGAVYGVESAPENSSACRQRTGAGAVYGAESAPLVLLVPEQATFQMERALLDCLGGRAFSRARILSFRRLAFWAFQEAGGPGEPEIGLLQRRLLLRLILRRRARQLRVFRRAGTQAGFDAEAGRLVAEFLRQRITPAMLREVAETLSKPAADAANLEAASGNAPKEAGRSAAAGRSYLAAKTHDLADIFEDYLAAINGRFLNPEEAAGRLAEALRRRPLLAGARVWIDGFSSFSAQELAALDEILRQSSEVDLCLCLDPGVERALDDGFALEEAAGELFAETGRTLRRLRARAAALGVPELEPLALAGMGHNGKGAKENGEARGRFSQAPDLAHLEAQWGRVRPIPWGGPAAREHEPPARAAPPSIRLVEAASPRAEAGAAAREMARLHREEGIPWRRMAIIARSIEERLGDLAPALREFGIPYFVDQRRPLDAHPLVAALKALARVTFRGWHSPDVFDLLKTGLAGAGIEPEAIDRLENYTIEHGFTGRGVWTSPRGWQVWGQRRLDDDDPRMDPREEARRREQLARINAWRLRIVNPLVEWEAAHALGAMRPPEAENSIGAKENQEEEQEIGQDAQAATDAERLAEALADWMRRVDAEGQLRALEEQARRDGDPARAEEHRQALGIVRGALEQMAQALGGEPLAGGEAVEIVETALADLRIGVIPPGLDAASLGSVDRSRQPDLDAALVIGLSEGDFPRARAQDPLLNDAERDLLRTLGCEVAPPSRELFLNESYLAYIAFTRAERRLWASRPLADAKGEALFPSPFWRRMRALFPGAEPEQIGGNHYSDWESADTPGAWASLWAEAMTGRTGGAGRDPEARAALERLRAEAIAAAPALAQAVQMAQCAAEKPQQARLDPALARKALVSQKGIVPLSLSRIESFAACPFQHFAANLLALEPRPEYRVEVVDLGSLYHAVMGLWVGGALERGEDLAALGEETVRAEIARCLDQAAPRLKNELLLSTARMRFLLERIRETLGAMAWTVASSLRRSRFRPVGAEVDFGMGGAVAKGAAAGADSERGLVLDPLEFDLGDGIRLRIRGRIDRLDATQPVAGEDKSNRGAAEGPATEVGVRVVDYKTTARPLDLGELYYGLQLQLAGYLLAVCASPRAAQQLGGHPRAAGAFYMPVIEAAPKFAHPDDAESETETDRHARRQMRGMFEARWQAALETIDPGEKGVFHRARVSEAGEVSMRWSDALADGDMDRVLAHAGRFIAASGRAILNGIIEVAPVRYGGKIPCKWCPFRPLCRFDDRVDAPRALPRLRAEEALERLRQSAPAANDKIYRGAENGQESEARQ